MTDMDKMMIEEVARAIYDAARAHGTNDETLVAPEDAEWLARAAITAINPDDRLREALEAARDKFREYEQHHNDEAQKIFRDGSGQGLLGAEIRAMNDRRAKAERNRELADLCDSALSPLPQKDQSHGR